MIKNILEYNNNIGAWYEYLTVQNRIKKMSDSLDNARNSYDNSYEDRLTVYEITVDGILDEMSFEAKKIERWVDNYMWEWYY